MAKFKGKADAAFENKLNDLLSIAAEARQKKSTWVKWFGDVEQVFIQYGTYLELIGGDAQSEQIVSVERSLDWRPDDVSPQEAGA